VLVLLILGGVVAAAVVIGRPYLFPGEFDEATAPYAEAVEVARGVEFTNSVAVVAESTDRFADRLLDEYVDWDANAPAWRALGLLSGETGPQQVSESLQGWTSSLYSTADGQVYRDEALTGPQADAAITTALAAASLDQEFRWSPGQGPRGLDGQVETLAEVERQTRSVLADSSFAVEVDPVEPAKLTFLPPVVAFRALAPESFAEFDVPRADDGNPLASAGPAGPGPLTGSAPAAAPSPSPLPGDTLSGPASSMDRAFWYLVFASYLDSATAFAASEAVVENTLTPAERGGRSCVYATFAGGTIDQGVLLSDALDFWTLAAPPELGANSSVLDDGTLQLVACDPGAGFVHPARPGVARELLAWRVAELAMSEFLATAPSTDGLPDRDAAWALVVGSGLPAELAALAPETSPAAMADIARAGVADVLAPGG
jgi:hypothetical protein